jgi:N-acetylglucosaminyl-diphospho-decaprenol L-rhamnosyltransferase
MVHAIVVTWQGAHLLPACLRALEAEARRLPAHGLSIAVVDNASTDGTAAMLTRDFPGVTCIPLSENLGFGRGCNAGVRRALDANADFALLVNNDVELEPGCVAALLAAARAHPEAGLFTGTLLFKDEELVNSTGLVFDALGRVRDRDFRLPLARLDRPDGPVAGVSGGLSLLRCSMLRQIGGFDPDYFAYYEDADLSLRAARAGWICWYVAAARARHRFSATFGRGTARQRFLLGRGHLRTLAKHQPPLRSAALVPLTAAWRMFAKAPLELLRRRPALAAAEVQAAVAGVGSALSAWATRVRRGRSGPSPRR